MVTVTLIVGLEALVRILTTFDNIMNSSPLNATLLPSKHFDQTQKEKSIFFVILLNLRLFQSLIHTIIGTILVGRWWLLLI